MQCDYNVFTHRHSFVKRRRLDLAAKVVVLSSKYPSLKGFRLYKVFDTLLGHSSSVILTLSLAVL